MTLSSNDEECNRAANRIFTENKCFEPRSQVEIPASAQFSDVGGTGSPRRKPRPRLVVDGASRRA